MKKNLSTGFISILCLVLCIGALVGIGRGINKNSSSSSVSVNEVISRGVHVEKISETANEYGEKNQVFQYSIEPSKATNHSVEVSLSYVDGTDCSDVMDYSLNSEEKQLTLSCKADFSKQVKAVLTSLSNKDAKATIILDYLMKPKNIKLTSNMAVVHDYSDWNNRDYNRLTNLNTRTSSVIKSQMFSFEYSSFTKSAKYSLKLDVYLELLENKSSLSSDFEQALFNKLSSKIGASRTGKESLLTTSEVYGCASTEEDQTALKAITKEEIDNNTSYIKYKIIGSVQVTRDTKKELESSTLTYFLYGNYSSY